MGSFIKNLIVVVVIISGLYFGYKLFMGADDALLTVDDGANEGQLVARQFLIRLGELEGIDFSSDLFADARFRSLVSFNSVPEAVDSGRVNPFAQ